MTKIEKKMIVTVFVMFIALAYSINSLSNSIEKIDRDEFLNSIGETIGKVKQGIDKHEPK